LIPKEGEGGGGNREKAKNVHDKRLEWWVI